MLVDCGGGQRGSEVTCCSHRVLFERGVTMVLVRHPNEQAHRPVAGPVAHDLERHRLKHGGIGTRQSANAYAASVMH